LGWSFALIQEDIKIEVLAKGEALVADEFTRCFAPCEYDNKIKKETV